ncbi:hypothetical protein PTSG_03320 [Salpingoeca rosetta]|uniref:Transcription initiation factor TFIID subunit 9 n=1 Tax=Salpingoeca rosetta (strain ATCC 50818 / BSB-021) TaxID=946362 RepID=F2U4U6_SALR5|nr:uncharacterized protein PTSG_03320 [Salpingoeca rosetta]EGD82662.1 hypothetical protein PTSG_03320 [Salpingoeca rosetta]|eukprot:XP_004995898.1 hypothetical protein PTSG_03320 [Salpingoeca rosetta]
MEQPAKQAKMSTSPSRAHARSAAATAAAASSAANSNRSNHVAGGNGSSSSAVKKPEVDETEPLTMPRTAKSIIQILQDMGIPYFEPLVVPQLLEFCQRYIHSMLEDGTRLAEHRVGSDKTADSRVKAADTVALTVEDVKLAIQSRIDFDNSAPPPREYLLEIAREKNDMPLPPIPEKPGLHLPQERYCLTNPNYTVKPVPKKSRDAGPWPKHFTKDTVQAAKRAQMQRRMRGKAAEEKEEAATAGEFTLDDSAALDLSTSADAAKEGGEKKKEGEEEEDKKQEGESDKKEQEKQASEALATATTTTTAPMGYMSAGLLGKTTEEDDDEFD